jgi:Flp pilus assembly protein TadD
MLKGLARSARGDELPAVSLHLLGKTLLDLADKANAEAVLREAQRRYPGDVWINYDLARCLELLGRRQEAIRYYIAVRSIRPETAHPLGHALVRNDEIDQGIAAFQDLVRVRPGDVRTLVCLSDALLFRGRTRESKAILDDAIARLLKAIATKPKDYGIHFHLGRALLLRGKLDAAIAEFREALRLKPDNASGHNSLAVALRQRGSTGEAIAEFREALRLKPGDVEIHNQFGITLQERGNLDEAIAEFREVLRLTPDYALAHNNIGVALRGQGRLDEAIAEFRETLQLEPGNALAHTNLGVALGDQGKLDEAIAEHRTALRLKPGYIDAHNNLGDILRTQGKYPESIAEFRMARDLARPADPHRAREIEQKLVAMEREASLVARLPAVLTGRLLPAGAIETLDFAGLSYAKKLHGSSARLWTEAFQARPELADDMQAGHRYNAACAAALAGCGQGKDNPPLDEAAKARWRKQAIDWLRADVVAWSKVLESGPPQARQAIVQTLQHWKTDPDLAGLRDPGAVEKLPKDEQDACRALWNAVDALLARAGGGSR